MHSKAVCRASQCYKKAVLLLFTMKVCGSARLPSALKTGQFLFRLKQLLKPILRDISAVPVAFRVLNIKGVVKACS